MRYRMSWVYTLLNNLHEYLFLGIGPGGQNALNEKTVKFYPEKF